MAFGTAFPLSPPLGDRRRRRDVVEVRAGNLECEDRRARRHPLDARTIGGCGGDRSGAGAVALHVLQAERDGFGSAGAAARVGGLEGLAVGRDAAGELWVREINPGADDGDGHAFSVEALRIGGLRLHADRRLGGGVFRTCRS